MAGDTRRGQTHRPAGASAWPGCAFRAVLAVPVSPPLAQATTPASTTREGFAEGLRCHVPAPSHSAPHAPELSAAALSAAHTHAQGSAYKSPSTPEPAEVLEPSCLLSWRSTGLTAVFPGAAQGIPARREDSQSLAWNAFRTEADRPLNHAWGANGSVLSTCARWHSPSAQHVGSEHCLSPSSHLPASSSPRKR